MNHRQQCAGYANSNEPAHGREQRHVYVIQHEHLLAQDRQAIEIFRSLMVRDRDNAGLQFSDMRLQCNGHSVAKPALCAFADDTNKPCQRRRRPHAEGTDPH